MTTAARPTWAPAKGGNEQGGARIFGPSQKYSSRDVAAHTTLKPRREGQHTQEELQKINLRDELEERERRHFSSKDKSYNDDRDRRRGSQLLLEDSKRDPEERIIPRSVDADDSDVDIKSDDDSDDESDDDDEDDTEALMAELDQIKKERVEERLRKVILLLSGMFLLRLLLEMTRIGFLKHIDITKISLVTVLMFGNIYVSCRKKSSRWKS
jgi:protein CWC15